MKQDDLILLTEEVQQMLPRFLFMQPRNHKYFDDWCNGGFYDMEEDVIPAIQTVMDRVADGKMVLKSFAYIHAIVRSNYQERTGTPSLDMLIDDLTRKFRGYESS